MSSARVGGRYYETTYERQEKRMSFEHVLAVVPVSDVEASRQWYEKLIRRAPDNNPKPELYK